MTGCCTRATPALLASRSKNRMAEQMGKITVDSPIPYLLSDLTNHIQTEMGKLDKAGTTAPYLRVKNKIDEIKGDPRFQFMFSGMLVGDTMADFIGKIFRLPSRGKPISIPATPHRGPNRIGCAKTTLGWKGARLSPRSATLN